MDNSFKYRLIGAVAAFTRVVWPARAARLFRNASDLVAVGRKRFGKRGHINLRRPFYLLGEKYMEIEGLDAGPRLRMECIDEYCGERFTPVLKIGKGVQINYNCHIGVVDRVEIADNVLIGSNVLITDHSHGRTEERFGDVPPLQRKLYSKGPVIIEEDVWIGENASILPGVTVGRGTIIGANSVVSKDVPAYSVVVGNPARVIARH